MRAAKAAREAREGVVYVVFAADGSVLVRRRPARGLLGGMLGLPGTAWEKTMPADVPPITAAWQMAGTVEHLFTHIALRLLVKTAQVSAAQLHAYTQHGDEWLPPGQWPALPTLFKKAVRLAEKLTSGG
jgi:A/G-specific adenine glycosylase